jgi:hypothetical protein
MAGSGARFSGRRRTAVVLTGEGVGIAYLSGVMKALDAAGVRVDVVVGRGAGALVAAFSALSAEERIHGEGGVLDALASRRLCRVSIPLRLAALCLSISFAAFLAPVLLGLASVVVLPLQAGLRLVSPEGAGGASRWLSALIEAAEPWYFASVALPVIAFFLYASLGIIASAWRRGLSGMLPRDTTRFLDLSRVYELLERRLWQLVRGASTGEAPPDRKTLSEAYVSLLTSGFGQRGFRELVFYALDTDSGDEVPFVVLKDRFHRNSAGAGLARTEPIDLAGAGRSIFCEALMAALSPPGLTREVAIKLPQDSRFAGEVHRFTSSVLAAGSAVADAVAFGAEQVIYVTSASSTSRPEGSLWDRLTGQALRRGVEEDLRRVLAGRDVPVFVVRPEAERLLPFELSGRAQLDGDRLMPRELVHQGEQDFERLFLRPVLGEDLPPIEEHGTIPIERDWEAGPNQL